MKSRARSRLDHRVVFEASRPVKVLRGVIRITERLVYQYLKHAISWLCRRNMCFDQNNPDSVLVEQRVAETGAWCSNIRYF